MSSRLLIVRNPDSPLLDYLDLDREDQRIFLIQNGVYFEKLKGKNSTLLDEDAHARKVETDNQLADYGDMVDAIFSADAVICV